MLGNSAAGKAGLGREELEKLLAFLGPLDADPGRAYARAGEMLESFFRWRGQREARELADRTLDRVARKLAGGEVVSAPPMKYALGVARMVLLEEIRRGTRERSAIETLGASPVPIERDPDEEARLARLEECAGKLAPEERELLATYHRDEGRGRIDGRKALAERLGVSINGLRVRTFRIRARLEKCLEQHGS